MSYQFGLTMYYVQKELFPQGNTTVADIKCFHMRTLVFSECFTVIFSQHAQLMSFLIAPHIISLSLQDTLNVENRGTANYVLLVWRYVPENIKRQTTLANKGPYSTLRFFLRSRLDYRVKGAKSIDALETVVLQQLFRLCRSARHSCKSPE